MGRLNNFSSCSEQLYANIFSQCRKSDRAGDVGKLQLVLLARERLLPYLTG